MRQTLTGNVMLDRCVVHDFALEGFLPRPTFSVDVAENKFRGFDGLLGMDYIGALETWISNSRRQLFVAGGIERFATHVSGKIVLQGLAQRSPAIDSDSPE